MGTSTLATLSFPTLYGVTDVHEFMAEFISNKEFRNWVGENAPTKKTNVVNYIWDKILKVIGLKKSEIDNQLIQNIEKSIDAVFDASIEKQKVTEPTKEEKETKFKADKKERTLEAGKLNKERRAKQDKLLNAEPTSIEDAVMQHFASGKNKIKTEDFKTETGFGIRQGKENKLRGFSDFRKRIWAHSKEGQSIDKMAMQIVEENPSIPATTEEVRNVIIDVLTSNETKTDMFNKLAETFEVEGEIYSDAAEAQQARQEGDYSRAYEEAAADPNYTEEQSEQIIENSEEINKLVEQEVSKKLTPEETQSYENSYEEWAQTQTEEQIEQEQDISDFDSEEGVPDAAEEGDRQLPKDAPVEQKAVEKKPTYKNLSTELTELEDGKNPASIGKQIASS